MQLDASLCADDLSVILEEAVRAVALDCTGEPATYIPELAHVPLEQTGVAITLCDGTQVVAGNGSSYYFTLQSVAKLVVLAGLLEEFGRDEVFSWINAEPSGQGFAAIDYADRFSPLPSNPMMNAGAIALCTHIPGVTDGQQLAWLDKWMLRLFNTPLRVNDKIYHSELATCDTNRSLAYLMRGRGVIFGDVEQTMRVYTALCSYETTVAHAAYLPMLLANGGLSPEGQRILTQETVATVVAIMATCGLYNESGMHLVRTGLPAKSGVSGIMIAVGLHRGGLAVFSPRLTPKGSSVRGQRLLELLAERLQWHFAW